MGKHLVYVAGAFAIIMILCAVTVSSTKKSTTTTQKRLVTNAIDNIQIEDGDGNAVTTNIWDYIRSQQEGDTIGDSNTSQDDEPQLTIVLQ